MKRGHCRGCGQALREVGQCTYCSRCRTCCNDADVLRSCAHRYATKSPTNQKRSDSARQAYWSKKYYGGAT